MNIDFILNRKDGETIEVIDSSLKNNFKFPPSIDIMQLLVENKDLGLYKTYDLIEYLQNGRVYKELCFIKAEHLGKDTIPDGIYEITYNVNNEFEKTRKFIFTYHIDKKFEELANSVSREVEVDKLGNIRINDTFDDDTMNTKRLNIAIGLYNDLKTANFLNKDTEIKSIMNKLNRLL